MQGRWWPVGIVTALGLTVFGNIWVAVIAKDDPSFAIEENYYQRALQFDAQRGVEQRSDRLGWSLVLEHGTASAAGTMLTVRLADSTGAPIADAAVQVRLTRVARSQQSFPVTLTAAGGAYTAQVPVDAAGLWDVALEARRGPARFVAQRRLDVPAGS
jgi:nitrogen fixation protein FixH